MKDNRWPKILLVGQSSRALQKRSSPNRVVGYRRKDLREMGTSREDVTMEALN